MRENQFSTWFSHDEYVGVKCMRTLPCRTRKSRTRWVLWLLTLSQMTWISCRSHWLGTMSVREATKWSLGWGAAGLPGQLGGGGVQRREQAQCAVSLVLESVALGTPWRQRQHPVLASH